MAQFAINIDVLGEMNFHWPPFLGFSVPPTLALIAFRRTTPRAQVGALIGLLLMVPLSLQYNLAGFRADMPALVLIAAAALAGLRILLHNHSKERITASMT